MKGKFREITTLTFDDHKSQSEGVIIIKAAETEISLRMSVLNGSDIEVRISPENMKNIIDGLVEVVDNLSTNK